jgi:hypothetical protein
VRHPARRKYPAARWMHPAARRTWKPGRFLHPVTRWTLQTARWVHLITYRTRHLSYRMHLAARRRRKPGRFLYPATRWTRQPARWKHPVANRTLRLSYRKHPAPRRTWQPTGFSIRRLAGCIRQLAGHGNWRVSLSGSSLDASPLSLEAPSISPDVETGRFLHPAPRRMRHPGDWTRHLTRRMHPAARRTRKSASFPFGASPDASPEPLDVSP